MAAPLVLVLVALANAVGAADAPKPLPLAPPPPDLRALVPFAAAPIDKPPVTLPELALPPTPDELPALPLARVEVPLERPIAPIPPPRALPCAASWLGIAAERLECGRARYQKAEYEDAAKVLEQAVRSSADNKELAREARYWLGETLWKLGRYDQADALFRQVAQESPRQALGVWAEHSSAWALLRRGNAARARDVFAPLVNASPPALGTWARAGLAIALYELGQNDQALAAWADVRARTVPSDLARDASFWYGEALGRGGDHAAADAELDRFTKGGAHPLLDTGLLRLGWWRLVAGRFADAANPLRVYVGSPQRGLGGQPPRERDWAEAGLAIALIASGDAAGAKAPLRALEDRRSPLVTPVRLRMARVTLEERKPAETRALVQELLGASLSAPARAWALLANAEAYRAEGNRDDARTQYDLAVTADPKGPTAAYSLFRLAQTNFEVREFTQAVNDAGRVLALPVTAETRVAASLLRGEAAYAASDYATAETAYARALADAGNSPQAAVARLSLAWTALRRGQGDNARKIFQEFAQAFPDDPRTPDALLVASEVALSAGDLEGGRQLLERILTAYPQHPRTPFARLNRGIMLVRAGRVLDAQPELREWIANTPFAPLLGRAHAALGVALVSANVPSEAAKEFTAARREGMSALAALGIGTVRLAEKRWDDAAREFTEARDTGTPPIAATAEYGLAVTAFQRGTPADFKAPAEAAIVAAPRGPMAPRLLYVLTGIAVDEKDWRSALANAKRLVTEFPSDEAADDALERVGAGAAAASAWPTAYESYALLRQKYPKSPFVEGSRLAYGLSELETGRVKEARQELEAFTAASPNDPRLGQALLALARTREAAGDRAAALEAYAKAARDGSLEWSTDATLRHARLLSEDRQWAPARTVLERLMKSGDNAVTAQAAAAIGQSYQGEGDQLAAAEYFMTAAYLDPDSATGRRALLAAAQSLAAVKQPKAAEVAYRKLLAQTDVPADLADTARKGLAALPR
ncbi:MAG TPA: tetratricopeptide repeat protein [Methylomirabilota bacterium]